MKNYFYIGVYEKFDLMTQKTIMAHCIYLSDEEIDLFKDKNSGISHCPNSNFSLSSGVLNVRRLLTKGMHAFLSICCG